MQRVDRECGMSPTIVTAFAMHPVRACLLLLLLLAGYANAYKQCAMPGGNAGECRPLKSCKPLQELNRKRVKTENELLYIKQSTCGTTSSFQVLICCPPEPLWDTFKTFKPVMFEEIVNYETVLREKDDNDISDRNLEPDNDDNTDKKDIVTKRPIGKPDQLASIKECGKDYSNANRIIGGGYAAIDQYPWLVLLEYNNNLTLCGGSLITTRYVLTAAHCIKRPIPPRFARLAEYNTTTFPTDFVETDGGGMEEITVDKVPIEKNIAHPNYTRAKIHHDIGISKLAREAELGDFIRLICLPSVDMVRGFRESMNLTVAGWGSDGIAPSDVKKHVQVPYVPAQRCQMYYEIRGILNSQLCAGGNANEDSCSGDSGGPLMYESNNTYIIVGIVSYGHVMCGTENVPGVYTNVYSYLDWLRDNMD